MVLRGDSCSEGRGFKSQHCILDGHCYTLILLHKLSCFFEKTKMNGKEAGDGPFI